MIDVRTSSESAEGEIEKSMMIDFLGALSFKSKIDRLDKNENYYIYCRSGQACQLIKDLGIDNVFNLSGGMLSWKSKTVAPK